MTTKTRECLECGEPVPDGRLSCAACGALVAAVSRSRRATKPSTKPSTKPPTDPPAAYLIDPAAPTNHDPELEAWTAPWPPLEVPEPAPFARPYGTGPANGVHPSGNGRATPGAYLPPSLAMSTTMSRGADRSSSVAAAVVDGGQGSADGSASATPASQVVDVARLGEVAGWFVVVGSAMAVLGFLLPWSVVVIGARSSGGYLDGWGLASPTHVLVLVGLLGVLLLGVVQTWVPAWFRTGVLGLGVGGLLIGLTWPYIFGPLGADMGVLVTALGGLALVIGGGVASWATRHAGADPVV